MFFILRKTATLLILVAIHDPSMPTNEQMKGALKMVSLLFKQVSHVTFFFYSVKQGPHVGLY